MKSTTTKSPKSRDGMAIDQRGSDREALLFAFDQACASDQAYLLRIAHSFAVATKAARPAPTRSTASPRLRLVS